MNAFNPNYQLVFLPAINLFFNDIRRTPNRMTNIILDFLDKTEIRSDNSSGNVLFLVIRKTIHKSVDFLEVLSAHVVVVDFAESSLA